jgi:hypothetical protein
MNVLLTCADVQCESPKPRAGSREAS